MPVTNDMILHFDQMKSFYRGLASGEVYPRWEEDTNRGFGAPTTSYYPPGVYYLTSALYAIVGDWMWTLFWVHFLMMAASALAMYLYARRLMARDAAIAAMTAYIFLPYHLIDQYQRGALAELLGFVFMPLVLLFADRLLSNQRPVRQREAGETLTREDARGLELDRQNSFRLSRNVVGLAATLALFLWSHPPTAYQFMLSFTLFVILYAVTQRALKNLMIVAFSTTLGLALSAAYLYPAIVEQDLIHHEFVSNTWPYESTYLLASGYKYDLIEFIWFFNVVGIVIGAVTLLILERDSLKPGTGLRLRVWLWVVIGCFASFMMTRASYPLGRLIPKIDIGVFAWRMLAMTTLVVALLGGACAQAALNSAGRRRIPERNSLASLAAVIIVGGALLMGVRIFVSVIGTAPFTTAAEHINLAMLPSNAPSEALELPVVDQAELAHQEGSVEVESWEPEHRMLTARLNAPDKLLLRTFYFPGWQATVDGETAPITVGEALVVDLGGSERTLIRSSTFRGGDIVVNGKRGSIVGTEPLGDIVIDMPTGIHRVTLDFRDTPARRLGEFITLASIALVLGFTFTPWVMGLRKRRARVHSIH